MQLALQQSVGLVTCLWSQLETNPGLAHASKESQLPEQPLSVHEVVDEVKGMSSSVRTIVLVGHVNAAMSKLRQQLPLETKDRDLAKYQRECDLPKSGQQLFGSSFM